LTSRRGRLEINLRKLARAGLRLQEALRLRVKDLDFGFRQIVVRDGKGGKDRFTVLPTKLIEPLQKQLSAAQKLYEQDLRRGLG
jgi:integrase